MKLFKINVTGYQDRKYNLYNVNLDAAKKHLADLNYSINSYELVNMELERNDNSYDIINDKGFLETIYTDKKPGNYSKDDLAVIRSFQRTQGSIGIPYSDILRR